MEPLFELTKNSEETICFQISEYRGHAYGDIRIYYRDDLNELRPTRKGLTISPSLWPAFLKGIEELGAALEERGLLASGRDEAEGDEAA